MEFIKEADFRKEIKTNPRRAYIFVGDEDYMKKFAVDTAVRAICPDPSFSFFNEIRLDSFSYSPSALASAFMSAPIMADRKIVILSGLDLNLLRHKQNQRELEEMLSAIQMLDEYDYNTLIITTGADRFDAGAIPKSPSDLLLKFAEYATPVLFEKNTPARLSAWIGKHFEHNGVRATPEVCQLVIERCGRDMFNLVGETDKLAFYALSHGKSEITASDVASIASPTSEYSTFALSNAIGARRRDDALDILRDMKQRRLEPVMILAEITKTVCDMLSVAVLKQDGMTQWEIASALKMNEFKVSIILRTLPDEQMCRRMLDRCQVADREMKRSYGGDGFAVIERLICTI